MEDDDLRTKARTVIASGKLPVDAPNRMWGGSGTGALCVVCDLPINRDEAEVDIEVYRDSGSPRVDKYEFHLRCFTAWERERATGPRDTSDVSVEAGRGRAGLVQRAGPGDASGKDDPICPICQEPIKPKERVSGFGDDLMHEACDHATRRHGQPPPAPSH